MRTIVSVSLFLVSFASAQYSVSTERSGTARQAGEYNHITVTVSDGDGKRVFAVDRDIPFDVPSPGVHLNARTGALVLCYDLDGFAEAYDRNGVTIWSVSFFKDVTPNFERTLKCAVGDSSTVFLISDGSSETAMLRSYTTTGTLQWERLLPYQNGYALAQSSDGAIVAASCYEASAGNTVRQTTLFVDNGGNERMALGLLFRKAAFSADGRSAILISKNEAYGCDLSAGEATRLQSLSPTGDSLFTDAVFDGKDFIVQSSIVAISKEGRLQYRSAQFTAFDAAFRLRSRTAVDDIVYSTWRLTGDTSGIRFRYDESEMDLTRSLRRD